MRILEVTSERYRVMTSDKIEDIDRVSENEDHRVLCDCGSESWKIVIPNRYDLIIICTECGNERDYS